MGYFNLAPGDKVQVTVNDFGVIYSFSSEVLVVEKAQCLISCDENEDIGFTVSAINIRLENWPPPLEGRRVTWAMNHQGPPIHNNSWVRIESVIRDVVTEQIRCSEPGGENCCICKTLTQYASANMSDGSFCCYNCRTTKGWKIKEGVYLK